jgi:hypothetical protein
MPLRCHVNGYVGARSVNGLRPSSTAPIVYRIKRHDGRRTPLEREEASYRFVSPFEEDLRFEQEAARSQVDTCLAFLSSSHRHEERLRGTGRDDGELGRREDERYERGFPAAGPDLIEKEMKVVLDRERPVAKVADGEGDVSPTAGGARKVREQPYRCRLGSSFGRSCQRSSGEKHKEQRPYQRYQPRPSHLSSSMHLLLPLRLQPIIPQWLETMRRFRAGPAGQLRWRLRLMFTFPCEVAVDEGLGCAHGPQHTVLTLSRNEENANA